MSYYPLGHHSRSTMLLDRSLWAGLKLILVMVMAVMMLSPLHADVVRRTEESAKKQKQIIIIPEGYSYQSEFIVGRDITLELRASVGSFRTVDFIIRQQPRHGVLSTIRRHPTENNRAYVVYRHNGNGAPLLDEFSYACRVGDGPYSAPSKITLQGRRFEPQLRVLKQPNFDRVAVGSSFDAVVEVHNAGVAEFKGMLNWQEPFHGPAELNIAAGASVQVPVRFTPKNAGTFRWELPLQAESRDAVIRFFASSIDALTVSPSLLQLQWDSVTQTRKARLQLASALEEDLTVELRLPAKLKGPQQVTVEPAKTTDVEIELSDSAEFQGLIEVVNGTNSQRITVMADPTPARIEVRGLKDEVLDFGVLEQDANQVRELTIANAGGQTLTLALQVLPPFELVEKLTSLQLQPQQARSIQIKLNAEVPGRYDVPLELSGNAESKKLKLRAVVQKITPEPVSQNQASVESRPISAPAVRASGSQHAPLSAHAKLLATLFSAEGVTTDPLPINTNLPRVESLTAYGIDSRHLMLAWKSPSDDVQSWRIEIASTGYDEASKVMVKFWSPIKEWQQIEAPNDGEIAAFINGFNPASSYELRVVGVDADQRMSYPSPVLKVVMREPWSMPNWVWRVLLFTGLAIISMILYRIKQRGFAA